MKKYAVFVWRLPGCTPFIVDLRESIGGDIVARRKSVMPDEVTDAVLEMLDDLGRKLAGTFPDFHALGSDKPKFWVVTKPSSVE